MSTALWLYYRAGKTASSNEEDLIALYRHAKQLDRICGRLSLTPLSAFHDLTDAKFNLGDEDLPDGMTSTVELMVDRGSWHSVTEGRTVFFELLEWLKANPTRFGLLGNDYNEVLGELKRCLESLEAQETDSCEFNLCVVQ